MIPYTIRPARPPDSRFLYELAMDPRIREMSTRSDEFSYEEHERWYAGKLANGLNAIWIMEIGEGTQGIPVGVVRYGKQCDAVGHDLGNCAGGAEIAIGIVPSFWRGGWGLRLLTETMSWALRDLRVDCLIALVLKDNAASCGLFSKAGFRLVGSEIRLSKDHWRFERP